MLLIFSQSAWALNCDQVRRDLLGLENSILNAQKPTCGGPEGYQLPNCCDPNLPNNPHCKARKDLEREYNELVGELIIAEGIMSLGILTESNHNKLIDIPSSDLTQAKEDAKELEKNLVQADILYKALDVPNENAQTIWTDMDFATYRVQGKDYLEGFLSQQCDSTSFSANPFCSTLNELARSGDEEKERLHGTTVEMLHGFMTAFAYNNVTISSRPETRNREFVRYQNKLKITITDGASGLSPADFMESEHYEKVTGLATNIDQYLGQIAGGDRQSTEAIELARNIQKQSSELDSITVQYADPANPQGSDMDPVISFLRAPQSFYNNVAQLGMRSFLPLNKNVKKNFSNTLKISENDFRRFENNFDKEIHEALIESKSTAIAGTTIEEHCNSNFNRECIKTLCQAVSQNNCTQAETYDNDVNQAGLPELFEKNRTLDKYLTAQNQLKAAETCLETGTLAEQKSCIENLDSDKFKNITQTNIDELKNKIKLTEELMVQQNSIEPFQTLNLEKAMTLEILNSKACSRENLPRLNVNRNYCLNPTDGTADRDDISKAEFARGRNVNEQYVELMADGSEILLKLNHGQMRDAINDEGKDFVTQRQREDIESLCKEDKSQVATASICTYFEDEERHREEIREQEERDRQAARRERIRIQRRRDEEPSDWELIGQGVLETVPFYITPLAGALVERQAVKDETRSMRRSIVAYDEWYMQNLPAWREYYNNPPQVSTANWGYDFNGTTTAYTFDNAASFQGASTQTNFARNNGVQFSFNAIPTTLSGGISTTTTSTSSGSSNSGASDFGFSF